MRVFLLEDFQVKACKIMFIGKSWCFGLKISEQKFDSSENFKSPSLKLIFAVVFFFFSIQLI